MKIFSQGKILLEGSPKQIFSDYDTIVKLGLDIPVTAYLERALKSVGCDLDSNLTVDGFIDAYLKGGEVAE